MHPLNSDKMWLDPLAQQVEHNTFNVGVLGSSPKRITKKGLRKKSFFFFYTLRILKMDQRKNLRDFHGST